MSRKSIPVVAFVTVMSFGLTWAASAGAGIERADGAVVSAPINTRAQAPAAASEDHAKARDEYLALAARYEADAAKHEKEAAAYRKAPNASESKRPMSPDTAAHCDRFAKAARTAAAEARALAAEHDKAIGK